MASQKAGIESPAGIHTRHLVNRVALIEAGIHAGRNADCYQKYSATVSSMVFGSRARISDDRRLTADRAPEIALHSVDDKPHEKLMKGSSSLSWERRPPHAQGARVPSMIITGSPGVNSAMAKTRKVTPSNTG